MNSSSLLVALVICFPAFFLAGKGSTWLVDYLIVIAAINRGIRRIVDYYNGAFDPFSPISLTPLIVAGLAALVVLNAMQSGRSRIGPASMKVLRWYTIACSMAFIVGLYYNRLGAVYDLANYLGPLGLFGMSALWAADKRVILRWSYTTVYIGVLVAAYGMWQYYTIPPWDAFWVRAVNFEGYLGNLRPTEMTVFATLNERGPAGTFFASTLLLILLRPKLLGPLSWPTALLVGCALLLTYVRTALIQVILACISLPVVTRGKGFRTLLICSILLALFGNSLIALIPSSDRITDRVSTLGNIQSDGSFQGRVKILSYALLAACTEPLGIGLGSHGLGVRIAGGAQVGMGDSTGYIELLRTFGWIGTAYIVAMLIQFWRSSTVVWLDDKYDENTALFRAWFVSGMIVLFSGNWLAGVSFFWLLAGYVVGQDDHIRLLRCHKKSTATRWSQRLAYDPPILIR